MKEEDKYYTPDISEFHIGFEYEFKMESGWIKCKCTADDSTTYPCNLIHTLKKGIFRVKFLNREDIESLGWVTENRIYTIKNNDNYYRIFILNSLTDCKKFPLVEIKKYSNESIVDDYKNGIFIFKGYIKNKSELKKLMQQLNIKKDV